MTRSPKFRICIASSIILLLILLTTDPQSLPSVVLVAPFVLLFVILAVLISLIFGLYGLSRSGRLRAGMIGAAMPVLLLLLKSLGQLTLRDTLAIFALFAIAYFYASRLGAQTSI